MTCEDDSPRQERAALARESLVTISDHNTLDDAFRIAHLPDTFLSVEVTTRFPEDDVPLHVLVWARSRWDIPTLQPAAPRSTSSSPSCATRGSPIRSTGGGPR